MITRAWSRNSIFMLILLVFALCKPIDVGAVSFVPEENPGNEEVEEQEEDEGEEEEENEEILVESICFSDKKITVGLNSSLKLSPTILPANATNKKVKWKSSKKSVATVSKDGTVKAKKKGTTTITCTAQDGSGIKATCKITVKKMNFTARTKRPSANSKHYYSPQNIYYNYDCYAPTGKAYAEGKYCAGNCTWYACGRASEILTKAKKKVDLSIFGPNPMGIWNKNKLNGTYSYGSTPRVGALVVFGQRYGSYHIAVVEKISGKKIYVSESGYKTVSQAPKSSKIVFHYGTIDAWNSNREIIGYIYLI